MPDSPHVAIHIVTHNSAATLASCLQGVKSQTYVPIECLVIDNASTDDSCCIAQEMGYIVHKNAENLGYAKAHNQLLRLTRSKYVLTLNPDAWIAPNFVSNLVEYLEQHSHVGAASGLLLRVEQLADTPTSVDSAGLMVQRSRRQRLRHEGCALQDVPRKVLPIFGPDGACAFYRCAMLEDIALEGEIFDEDFFMHKEDVDVCWRAQMRGWDAVFIPWAVAHHIRSFRPGKRQALSDEVRFYAVRNRYLKILKNEDLTHFVRDLPFILSYDLALLIYLILFERQSLAAYSSVWRLRQKMLHKRTLIQKGRRRSLRECREQLRIR